MRSRLVLGAAVVAAALVAAAPAAAFTPTNSLYAQQWYLPQDHAFDAWQSPPQLDPVKVAIIDSGVDCSLPDFGNRLLAERSFVGGSACNDTEGHGTIVAGEIAGNLDSSGIVGIAYTADLLIAKVVAQNGTIPLGAEAAAIRWAANQGARVINLSFGAVRDPRHRRLDSYSPIEADAVAYAQKKGALVVAAAGNSDEAYATPWDYASWPAALPHVIGVGALTRQGNVPLFSDRDQTFVDIAAPGVNIFSTFPLAMTALQQSCTDQGYTDCAPNEYTHPEGTSFAAPQVTAAAAVLFGVDPSLTADQVGTILERRADDVNSATGCPQCATGRDRFSGWGRLDVANAVQAVDSGAIPPADSYEPNDTLAQAHELWGSAPTISATIDHWDDPLDVYRVRLKRGQALTASLTRSSWHGAAARVRILSGRQKAATHLRFTAPRPGWYYLQVQQYRSGGGAYTLSLRKSPRH